ncbi:MAG TPA: hypothetical protein VNU46_00290 [Gemmatimonadaceae bacterium]|nr:hypothetical protein [Gemmatimonadaceae bacterium]
MKLRLLFASSVAAALVVNGAASCHSSSESDRSAGGGAQDSGDISDAPLGDAAGDAADAAMMLPFTANTPATYVAKAKNLLVGLPPTPSEVQQGADPTQFANLVNQWMTSTQPCPPLTTGSCAALYQKKMQRFFELAFQQTQITAYDFNNQTNGGALAIDNNAVTQQLFVQNNQEVFARTMVSYVTSNPPQPFNSAMTTSSYMMTTAMRSFFALLDAWQLNDGVEGNTDYFQQAYPNVTIQVSATNNVPASKSADPSDPDFMIWYDPKLKITGCSQSTLQYAAQLPHLWYVLNGIYSKDSNGCSGTGTGTGQFLSTGEPNDFDDWTMVTISQPSNPYPPNDGGTPPLGPGTTPFFDLPGLRTASKMTLVRPYVGYFTTPAFFANWQTNASNQMRVTTNQTLIVATGMAIDPNDMTMPNPNPPPGLDQTHANEAACQACHIRLDPTRSIFASTFSWYYGQQTNFPATETDAGPIDWMDQKGLFVFEGVNQAPTSIYDFGQILSTHPLLKTAWVQKLCYYFDSEACISDGTDSVFGKLVSDFANGYSWNALVQELLVSPLTTYATSTVTATTNGETVAVSRRDHLCAALNARLGFADVCNLSATKAAELPANVEAIIPALPSDGYGRGSAAPVLPNNPSLFYRAGTENFCEAVAQVVVDPSADAGVTTWKSSDCQVGDGSCAPDGGVQSCPPIADFVTLVAGIPSSDARFCPLYQAFVEDFVDNQSEGGASKTTALQSTFTAACMAPSAVTIGL